MAYHVVNWDERYEHHQSRILTRHDYVYLPNAMSIIDLRMSQHQRGPELLASWYCVLKLASANPLPYRGWLIQDGTPLTARDIAALTRLPAKTLHFALVTLSKPEYKLLELIETPPYRRLNAALPPDHRRIIAGYPPQERRLRGATAAPSGLVQSVHNKKRGGDPGSEPGKNATSSVNHASPAPSAVAASRTRWASLTKRIKELEGQPEEQLTGEERLELKQNRADLAELERNQRKGKFG